MRELAIFAVAYLVYFGVRALTEGGVAAADANALALIRFERDVRIEWEGAIQDAALAVPIVLDAANAVYVFGHWPVILVAGVLLFRYRRPHYIRLRDAILLSGFIGLVIFALFPVTPPRLTDLPLVDTVTRDDPGYRQILPPALVNEYAAMPSFHAGWNLLVGIVVFGATRNPLLRALAVLIPAAMMLAAVATANHFVIDVLAGISIALASLFAADRLREYRHTVSAPADGRDAHASAGLPRTDAVRTGRRTSQTDERREGRSSTGRESERRRCGRAASRGTARLRRRHDEEAPLESFPASDAPSMGRVMNGQTMTSRRSPSGSVRPTSSSSPALTCRASTRATAATA